MRCFKTVSVPVVYCIGCKGTNKNETAKLLLTVSSLFYAPTQLVAPRAVTMAVATDAMICTINLNVSFFVMVSLGY